MGFKGCIQANHDAIDQLFEAVVHQLVVGSEQTKLAIWLLQ
jgi:hypothetical protein